MRASIPWSTAIALLAGAFFWFRAPATPPGLRFPEGEVLRYRFEHTGEHEVSALGGAPPMAAEVDLAGEVVLRGLGRVGDDWQVALSLGAFERDTLTVGGKDALGDPASMRGLEAVVELSPHGEVRGLRFPAQAPHPFQNLVHLVVSEVQIRLDEGTYEAVETTQHGRVRSRYSVEGDALRRERMTYERLQVLAALQGGARGEVSGRASVELADGHWRRLAAEETLTVRAGERTALHAETSTRFELVAVEADAARRPAPAVGARVALGAAAAAPDREAHLAAQRIDGLTPDALEALLTGPAAQSGQLPDHNRTLWRAVGLLRQEPALCETLGALAASERFGSAGRGLVLDLLTSAGTSAAQMALRAALDAPAVRRDPRYVMLFQRTALLTLPDAETLAYLERHYTSPGEEGLAPAAYALGAAAGQAAGAPDGRGRALADRLLRDLQAASTPDHQALRLVALGNAGLAEHVEALTPYARAPHPEVRRAAAAALRKLDDPRARHTLLTLAGDGDARVQRRALESLARKGASVDELPRLTRISEQLAESSLDLLVDLAAPHAHLPEGRATLEAVLSRTLKDTRIKGRIRALLGLG